MSNCGKELTLRLALEMRYVSTGIARDGVADLGYEGLNMQVRETSIHKTSGFSSYFFHTLIKQRQRLHGLVM
jgi:hypothetical protein